MKDPKAIRKAIMTARSIAAMVDPNFARVPLPQIGEPDPEETMQPEQFSMGGRLPARRSDNPFEQFQPQDPFSFDLPDHSYASGGEVYGDNSKIPIVGSHEGEHRLVPISPKNTNYRHVMEYVPIDWLMERRGNEYRHSPERMEQLRNEIQEEGLREPVLISTGKNSRTSIVGEGNHRVLAAKQLGYTHIPVRAMVGSSAGSDRFPEGAHDEDIIPEPNRYFPSDAKPSRVMRSLGYEGQPELPEDWWEKGYAAGGEVEQPTDYSAPDDMGLYSRAAATAANLPQAKASPQEFRGMLLNSPGVKKSEFDAAGYDQAFADQPQVTREQVAKHFHENRTPIEEKGFYANDPRQMKLNELEKGYWDKARGLMSRKVAYRDANPDEDITDWGREEGDAIRAEYKKARAAVIESKDYAESAGDPHHESFTIPGGANYREILLKHGKGGMFPGAAQHFGGEPDVLASLMVKDRKDHEDKDVFHIEEMQSDWAQRGRKGGFEHPAHKAYDDYVEGLKNRFNLNGRSYFSDQGESEDEIDRLMQSYRRDPASMAHVMGETKRHNELVDDTAGIPKGEFKSAPYITKTEDWVSLALKRALREAAENGYDKLAWSPGSTIADRYSLADHVGRVSHEKNDDGTYNLSVRDKKGSEIFYEEDMAPEKISDYLGKGLTDQILAGEGTTGKEAYDHHAAAKSAYDNFMDQAASAYANSLMQGEDIPEDRRDVFYQIFGKAAKAALSGHGTNDPENILQEMGMLDEYRKHVSNLQDATDAKDRAPEYSPYRDWRHLEPENFQVGEKWPFEMYDRMISKEALKLAKQHDPEAKLTESIIEHDDPKGYAGFGNTALHAIEITPKMRESISRKGFAAHADGGRVEGYAGGGDVDAYQDPATQHISDWNWRPVEDVQESLGGMKEIPSHVEKFGDFMDNIAQRAAGSGLTPRDLIKAYTITRSSIQRQAADVNKLRASGLDLPEEMTGKIRPEGAFGEWLHTPAGQAYLDAAEKGKVHQTAIQNAIQVMAPFGRHQTDIPDALTWAALNLPGKEKQVSELVHAGHLMASTPEEWRAFTQHIRGVGPSKSGFLASLMGRGDQPTLDARQIILHTGRPTKEASKYIAKKGGAGGVEAVDRLAARQSAMDLSLPDRLKPYYQHLAHHAVWDKAGNDETTHEDVVRAMHHAASGGAQNGDDESILSHPVAKIFQTIGMAGLNDPSVDPAKFKEYLKRAQYALARKITTKGSDVLASYPGAANVKMSKFGKPLSEMESTAVQKGFMLPRKEADIEEMQRRGSRIFPFLGDLSPADQILLKSGQTNLIDPSEQQGGAGFMRSEFAQGRDPAAYGNRVGAAKTLAKKIAAQTPEGTPAIGTHVAMGLGSVDSSHHAYEPILRMIPNSPIQQKHIDEFDDMMREALPPSKKYPMAWPGIMNTEEAEHFFAGRPGTHASFFAKKIDSSKWQKAGFPDIGEVRFSASTPELLGAPRLSTGSAFSQVEPSGRIVTNPDLKHKTYPALIPSKGEGYMGGSSIPIPAKLMFSDFYKTMKTKDKSGKALDYDSPAGQTLFQQSLMTKVPYQDATQEWLDGIMEDRRQKQEQGFKKGGKVRSALMIAKGMKKR